MSNPQIPFIFTLPNETLLHICSLLSPYDRVRFRANDDVEHNLPQILILRSISRRFREISYYLRFWYEDDADFSDMLPSIANKYVQSFRERHFFDALYKDKCLINCLSKKTGWVFSSMENLLHVLAAVPLFRSSVRRLTLKPREETDVWPTIRASAFVNWITELSLHIGPLEEPVDDEVEFDLSCIGSSFPFLQTLIIMGINTTKGVLHDRNLRRLVVHACYTGDDFISFLLPLKSAQTLTSFCIINVSDPFSGMNQSLDLFTNLTDFEVVPIHAVICKVLTKSTITLRRFAFRVLRIPSAKLIEEMFSSRCFRNLQELTINCSIHGIMTSEKYLEDAAIIVEAITYHLQSVHTLALDMGMDISWCGFFTRMTNLKSLRWAIHEEEEGQVLFRHGLEDSNRENSLKEVIQKFERIFENFEEKPSLSIDFNSWYFKKFYGPN